MPVFKGFSDIEKYVDASQGYTNIGNGQTAIDILSKELNKLADYIREEINKYYDNPDFDPVEYIRTEDWKNSVRISPITQSGNQMSAKVYFEESLANHPSLFNGEEGYVPWLMEKGWHWSPEKSRRGRLSDFEGIQYVKKAVDRFNKDNIYGIKVVVYHNGEVYYDGNNS